MTDSYGYPWFTAIKDEPWFIGLGYLGFVIAVMFFLYSFLACWCACRPEKQKKLVTNPA